MEVKIMEQNGKSSPNRNDVREVFKKLRKEYNIWSRMNYMCCSGCATANADAERPNYAQGFVYFHEQDNDNWESGHPLDIRYMEFDDGDYTAKEIGEIVAKLFIEQGIFVNWNGESKRVIQLGKVGKYDLDCKNDNSEHDGDIYSLKIEGIAFTEREVCEEHLNFEKGDMMRRITTDLNNNVREDRDSYTIKIRKHGYKTKWRNLVKLTKNEN